MRVNEIRRLWEAGKPVLNAWLSIPNSWSAELMVAQPLDAVTIDMQHGLMGYAEMLLMLQAMTAYRPAPLVRVPWNEPGIIMKALDAGALGIICPMINSRDECERFVGACRYAPYGYRSYGPQRAALIYGEDYFEQADQQVLTFAMIETAAALEHLDEIMSVPGLTGVYIGPADLTISLGLPLPIDWEQPQFLAAIDRVLAGARAHHIHAGLHIMAAGLVRSFLARGFDFATVISDTTLLTSGTNAILKQIRGDSASDGVQSVY